MLHVALVCVGRVKAGPERELAERYLDRARSAGRTCGLGFTVREFDESRAKRPDDRKAEEARAIVAQLDTGSLVYALDETGRPIDSSRFAGLIGSARDDGVGSLAIVIGGPDGLDPSVRQAATQVIGFGAMTWPHQLVRVMASEQLYRAVTILNGHPYHRA